jgi:hypothetical protein
MDGFAAAMRANRRSESLPVRQIPPLDIRVAKGCVRLFHFTLGNWLWIGHWKFCGVRILGGERGVDRRMDGFAAAMRANRRSECLPVRQIPPLDIPVVKRCGRFFYFTFGSARLVSNSGVRGFWSSDLRLITAIPANWPDRSLPMRHVA